MLFLFKILKKFSHDDFLEKFIFSETKKLSILDEPANLVYTGI